MQASTKPKSQNIDADFRSLISFVLIHSETVALSERIPVLRGLVQIIPDPQQVSNLNEVIAGLESANSLALEFTFETIHPKP